MKAMECINKIMNALNKTPLLMSGLLVISGCDNPPPPQADVRITNRPVATVYKIRATKTDNVQCYRIRNSVMTKITTLKNKELVEIVAIEEGLVKFNDKLWLQIYPRLTHRPGCYVNVDNLIPYR